jgi:Flp pilus assembly protein TadG
MIRVSRFYTHRKERGITLLFVVVAIFALLGMAALAIDLVTLYVSKAEAQRVADAAALAGAKVLVDGGVTADPTNSANQWDTACDLATVQAQQVASLGSIGGVAPPLASINVCFGFNGSACSAACPTTGNSGSGFGVNPQVGVTLHSATLPLFFSKIWAQKTATVSATGLAEAFNPSGTNFPVATKCVMPWLLPNIDPGNTAGNGRLIRLPSGQIRNAGPPSSGGKIGESLNLIFGCKSNDCTLPLIQPVATSGSDTYYPLDLPNPAVSGPSCSLGGLVYQQNIVACNPTPIACGDQVTVNSSLKPVDQANNQSAVQCLIGATGAAPGVGQDSLNTVSFPFTIQPGANNPLVLNGKIASTDIISSSPSIVSIPIYDSGIPLSSRAAPVSPVTVIGFMQVFVTGSANGNPTLKVLNVSGCGTTARTSSVAAIGTNENSSVPVRLIHQ